MHQELNLNIAVEPAVKADFPDLPFIISVGHAMHAVVHGMIVAGVLGRQSGRHEGWPL